jgi:prevent-host-death family protein
MIDLTEVRSLTDFSRNAKSHLKRLKRTGKPQVLTVNGEAEVIVQSADSYQKLLEDAELSRALRVISKSLEESAAGKSRPMRQRLEALAAKHGIQLKN